MPTTEELIQQLKELAESAPETRSKRMQILVTPSMFDALKRMSEVTGRSVNDLVNRALTEYLKCK